MFIVGPQFVDYLPSVAPPRTSNLFRSAPIHSYIRWECSVEQLPAEIAVLLHHKDSSQRPSNLIPHTRIRER